MAEGMRALLAMGALLAACTDEASILPGTADASSAAERVVVLSGDGGQLLAFDPKTSSFAPLGPPVPSVGPYSRVRFAAVRLEPLRLLAIDSAPGGGPEGAYVSDGGEWRSLAKADEVRVLGSDGLELLWVSAATNTPDEGVTETAAVHRFGGGTLFEVADQPQRERPRLIGFGPHGRWFLSWSRPNGYLVMLEDGTRHPLAEHPGGIVHAFENSMITSQPSVVRWRDLEGQGVARPGFTQDGAHLSHDGPYQLVDGALSLLADTAVTPLADLPASVTIFDLRTHHAGGRYVIAEVQDGLTAYAPDGAVLARYEAPVLPGQFDVNIDVSPRLAGPQDRHIVRVEHWGRRGDSLEALGRSTELWTLYAAGVSQVVPLRFGDYDSNLTNAAVTTEAYFYVEDRKLVQVDLRDGARREWTYEGGLLDVGVQLVGRSGFAE